MHVPTSPLGVRFIVRSVYVVQVEGAVVCAGVCSVCLGERHLVPNPTPLFCVPRQPYVSRFMHHDTRNCSEKSQ